MASLVFNYLEPTGSKVILQTYNTIITQFLIIKLIAREDFIYNNVSVLDHMYVSMYDVCVCVMCHCL